jgi:hypothetical protein
MRSLKWEEVGSKCRSSLEFLVIPSASGVVHDDIDSLDPFCNWFCQGFIRDVEVGASTQLVLEHIAVLELLSSRSLEHGRRVSESVRTVLYGFSIEQYSVVNRLLAIVCERGKMEHFQEVLVACVDEIIHRHATLFDRSSENHDDGDDDDQEEEEDDIDDIDGDSGDEDATAIQRARRFEVIESIDSSDRQSEMVEDDGSRSEDGIGKVILHVSHSRTILLDCIADSPFLRILQMVLKWTEKRFRLEELISLLEGSDGGDIGSSKGLLLDHIGWFQLNPHHIFLSSPFMEPSSSSSQMLMASFLSFKKKHFAAEVIFFIDFLTKHSERLIQIPHRFPSHWIPKVHAHFASLHHK